MTHATPSPPANGEHSVPARAGFIRKNLWFWINVTLLHAVLIAALWFPVPLHLPSRADLLDAWHDVYRYVDRQWLHPEAYRLQLEAEQQAAQRRIAELPPALIARAEPKNRVYQIRCPQAARSQRLHGSVFIVADITAQGTVGKAMIIEPAPNEQVNQLILNSFKQAKFKPAMDEHQRPAPDQVHFNWPYDCR